MCSHFHGSSFEEYFTTARKDRCNLICYIEAYDIFHPTGDYNAGSGGVRPLPGGSKTDALKSLGNTLKFNDSCLQ